VLSIGTLAVRVLPIDRGAFDVGRLQYFTGDGRRVVEFDMISAVAERGVVVWQGSRGLADLGSHSAINSETSFSIGSVSKQFTAIGVLLLEQAGQLSTSDPLSQHVPGMPGWAERDIGTADASFQRNP
jgi:CubicO group peptidase (beta-lactamase class C family)